MDNPPGPPAKPEPDLFFTLSLDMLVIAGFDGFFKHVNPAWTHLLGLSLDELEAHPYLEFVHPDDRAATAAEAERLAAGAETRGFENRFRTGDGTYRWLRWSANAHPAERLIYAMARDVTDRKQAELALQRAARRLELLHTIDRAILAARSPRAIAEAALAGLRDVLTYERASVTLFDFKRQQATLLAVDAAGPTELAAGTTRPLSDFESVPALSVGRAQHVPDMAALPAPSPTDRRLLAEGLRARLNLPLRAEGELLGALNLAAAAPGSFSPDTIKIAGEVADQLAVAVHQAQLQEDTRQRLAELAGLHELSAAMGALADVRQTYGRLAEGISRLIGARRAVVVLRGADGQVRAQAPGFGLSDAEVADLAWPLRAGSQVSPTPAEVYTAAEFPADIAGRLAAAGMGDAQLAPMWAERLMMGYVVVADKPGGFGPADTRLLGVFATQAAMVIHNARLFEQVQQHALETAALLASAEAISSSLAYEAALSVIADQARSLLAGAGSCLFLREPDGATLRCVVAHHPEEEQLLGRRVAVGQGPIGQVAQGGQPRAVTTSSAAGEAALPGWSRAPEHLALAPLVSPGGTLGVMVVARPADALPFGPGDLRLLAAFAVHAALALERARLYESERAAREQAEVLQAANMALTEKLDLDTVLAALLEQLSRLVAYDSASVMLVENGTRAVIRAMRGYSAFADPAAVRALALDVRHYANLRQVIFEQRSVLIPDTAAEPNWVTLDVSAYIRSWVGVPLIAGGKVIGVYSLDKAEPNFFTVEHCRRAEALAGQAAVAIQNARLFEQVRQGREQLQALSHRLVDAQEAERRALARELHDEIGQTLTGLKLALGLIPRLPPEAVPAKAAEAAALVSGLMERVHALSLDLRPAMLDDLGLVPALLWLFERYSAQTGVAVRHEFVKLDGRWPAEVETAAYRIVQEALTNVARHAGVSEARVWVMVEGAWLRLQVQDEGRGFDPAAALAGGQRAGLAGMQERAALLGGNLQVDSRPGAGTLITAVLPLAHEGGRPDEYFDLAGG